MNTQKNPGTTFILALLLGWVGAHRFYLGQIGMGVLYLVTGGLLGVGWVIDIFRARSLTAYHNLASRQQPNGGGVTVINNL